MKNFEIKSAQRRQSLTSLGRFIRERIKRESPKCRVRNCLVYICGTVVAADQTLADVNTATVRGRTADNRERNLPCRSKQIGAKLQQQEVRAANYPKHLQDCHTALSTPRPPSNLLSGSLKRKTFSAIPKSVPVFCYHRSEDMPSSTHSPISQRPRAN